MRLRALRIIRVTGFNWYFGRNCLSARFKACSVRSAVCHNDITWMMERGVRVFGSADLGVLRAAELRRFRDTRRRLSLSGLQRRNPGQRRRSGRCIPAARLRADASAEREIDMLASLGAALV